MAAAKQKGLLESLRNVVSRMNETTAPSQGASDAGTARMQIPQIAAVLGLPEDRVAQMTALVRANGIDEVQMGSMMRMASAKGLSCDQIMAMLTSMGVERVRVVRIMQSQSAQQRVLMPLMMPVRRDTVSS